MSETKFDLAAYMSDGIREFMAAAYRNVLSNPREARFVHRMRKVVEKSERRRREVLESDGLAVPPFLIASIATTCNLHCKGCYARSNGIAEDDASQQKATLTPEQWRTIMAEAASLGVNFTLLAGGEPMMRHDIIEAVASVKEMIFPVFTNGTLIGPTYIDLIKRNLNIVPVISIEGTAMGTDERRGRGVFERAMLSMDMLGKEDLIFGASITVTSENMELVTSPQFIESLRAKRCRLLFYIEYVPTEKGTERLALDDGQVERMAATVLQRRNEYGDIIFFSFPGDEKETGGCIASGRGFFHIGPDGSAEPCPFSPFSDSDVLEFGVKGALQSPLFRTLRDASILGWAHTGGCTLYEHQDEVEAMMNKLKKQSDMKTAIRYYSKFGHSKQMAEAIEEIVGAKAATVAEPLSESVDTLYLGAGVFLGKVNSAVLDFIASLTPNKVGRVVCFGSCAIINSPVPQMRKALEAHGIKVSEQSFTCKGSMGPVHSGHPDAQDIDAFKQFIQSTTQQ